MLKATYRMKTMYPNICDMIYNPAFYAKVNSRMNNNVMNFWNLVGARERKPFKFECEVCHVPMRKRGKRVYMVCQRCLHRYIADVRFKNRVPKFHVLAVAAE
jgi:hypothetical protein